MYFPHNLVDGFLGFIHVSEAGCPAAAATSDSGPDHPPPALKQSARCSAVRGDPARRTSHPGKREMGTDYMSAFTCILLQKNVHTSKMGDFFPLR